MEKTTMSNTNYGASNTLYQPSNLPNTVPPTQSGQLDLPFPSNSPENGLHPDGYYDGPNVGQATGFNIQESDNYGCTIEPEELDHTCLYHSILDKLDMDESMALDEVDRLSNLRESLSDPTVQKVLELLEYING